ncbi:MAG: nucleotidyltransferase domain-containing protein [Candidatus Nanohaloarchaea archaeon]|nr:nucleotidyltransferase domain-containing protein [Candidatus Nanohaloarchaea archaeon]
MSYFGEVLVSRKKLEVLEKLVENPDYEYSIRELSEQCKASFGTVRKFINELEDEEVVKIKKKTGTYLISYNQDNRYHEMILELLRSRIEELENTAREVAKNLSSLEAVRSVILFGSVAKGTAEKDSDIDVLVLVNQEEVSESIAKKIREISSEMEGNISQGISPLTMSFNKFVDNLKDKERFEVEVKNTGIILEGETPWKS